MRNNKKNDEVNFFEIILFINKNKWKIFLITIGALFLGYFYSYNQTPIYKVETEIMGISDLDEFRYQTYNSYIIKKNNTLTFNENTEQRIQVLNDFDPIDKKILLSLFNEKIYDQHSLIRILKKSGYINKKDYQNSEDYENAIQSVSSSIKLIQPNKKNRYYHIQMITSDLEKWEQQLIYIDKFVNEEIQDNLREKFYNNLESEKIIKKIRIDDFKTEINNLNNVIKNLDNDSLDNDSNDNIFVNELRELRNEKKMQVEKLIASNDIQRMEGLFRTTPIMNENEFYAAKIMYLNSKFDNINKIDKTAIIIIFGFIGLIVSIFYIRIIDSFKNRK